jgi:hypothetical protein
MCQMCEEADAYVAQLEAAAKKRAKEQQTPDSSAEKDAPRKTAAAVR